MKVKTIIFEDFVNYKKPSMFIATSKCDFKCDKECGKAVCQNSHLATAPNIDVDDEELVQRYINNPITEAIVFGGLESFDSFDELFNLIYILRQKNNNDDFIIYTGYYPEEIYDKVKELFIFKNIIIKFGRFIPDRPHKFDETLGIELASNNQFALTIEEVKNYYEQRKNI